jgi:hypothetical protein
MVIYGEPIPAGQHISRLRPELRSEVVGRHGLGPAWLIAVRLDRQEAACTHV